MRLLFDEQLSPALARRLQDEFPGALHLSDLGLSGAPDRWVWRAAVRESCVLVTKDGDFERLVLESGVPCKVLWLRVGNTSTDAIEKLLRGEAAAIREFIEAVGVGVLRLP